MCLSNRSERWLPAEAELSAWRLQDPEPGLILIPLWPAPKMSWFRNQTAGSSAWLSTHVQLWTRFKISDLSTFANHITPNHMNLSVVATKLAPYSTFYYSKRTCLHCKFKQSGMVLLDKYQVNCFSI